MSEIIQFDPNFGRRKDKDGGSRTESEILRELLRQALPDAACQVFSSRATLIDDVNVQTITSRTAGSYYNGGTVIGLRIGFRDRRYHAVGRSVMCKDGKLNVDKLKAKIEEVRVMKAKDDIAHMERRQAECRRESLRVKLLEDAGFDPDTHDVQVEAHSDRYSVLLEHLTYGEALTVLKLHKRRVDAKARKAK